MKGIGAISGISLAIAMGIAIAAKAQTPTNRAQPATVSETACVAITPAEQRALNAAKNEARQMAERVKVEGAGSERTFSLEYNGPIEDYTRPLTD